MQTAHILLSLGGDSGNVVPKYNVTAAEIAVLRHIHGDEAVMDVEPSGEVKRNSRVERQRLVEAYGRRIDGRFASPAVDALFPGAASRVFETLDELDLPEEFFKAERRVKARPARQEEPVADEEVDGSQEQGGETEEDDDGIGEIADEHAGQDAGNLFN